MERITNLPIRDSHKSYRLLLTISSLLVIGGYTNVAHALPCDFKNGDYFGNICGYFSAGGAVVGGNINVHVSTSQPNYDIEIRRVGATNVLQSVHVSNGIQYKTKDTNFTGMNWGSGVSVNLPNSLRSGLYEVTMRNQLEAYPEYVAVRSNNPGSYSKVLLLDSLPTNMAYDPIGGKSLYGFNSTHGQATTIVTTERPTGRGEWLEHIEFAKWLDQQGIAYEAASMLDLERDPSLLKNYNLVLSVGHNEYWSKNMRDAWDGFIANGGNAAVLSGNTMWWQIRFSNNMKQMICYKDPTRDPLYGVQNELVTTNWYSDVVNKPENTSIGVSFRHGGYADYTESGVQHYVKGGAGDTGVNGGFQVTAPSHWVFDGTGVSNGTVFGREATIAGYEVDGALFQMQNGKPVVTGEDGTPTNFQILALTPAYAVNSPSGISGVVTNGYKNQGWGTMGIFKPSETSGTVFVAPTVDWAEGVASDAVVSRITTNVINKLKVREQKSSDDSTDDDTSNTDTGTDDTTTPTDNTSNTTDSGSDSNSTTVSNGSSGGGGSFGLLALMFGLLGFVGRRRLQQH